MDSAAAALSSPSPTLSFKSSSEEDDDHHHHQQQLQQQDLDVSSGITSREILENTLLQFGIDVSLYGKNPSKSISDLYHEIVVGETCLVALHKSTLASSSTSSSNSSSSTSSSSSGSGSMIDCKSSANSATSTIATAAVGEYTLVRRVSVVSARIRHPDGSGRILYEIRQEWPNIGRIRERHMLLSGKMVKGEDFVTSLTREITEELGSALLIGKEEQQEQEGGSLSKIKIIEDSLRIALQRCYSPSYPGLLCDYETYTADVDIEGIPTQEVFQSTEVTSNGPLLTTWRWEM